MIPLLLVVVAALLWFIWLCRAGLVAARMYQIEEYETARFLAWGKQRAWLWPAAVYLSSALTLVLVLAGLALPGELRQIGQRAGWLAGVVLLHLLWKPLPAKKALVFTARMRRLLGAGSVLALLVCWGVSVFTLNAPAGAIVSIMSCLLAPALVLLFTIAGSTLMMPVEALVRRSFLLRAHTRITHVDPFVIGIAGSYGKTSTKHFLAQLLAPCKETLATPKSFNTLMGLTRTINEYLEPQHELFLAEMDAYARGEIAAMCRLVAPQIALITSVGPQHLERFGSIERISDALYELVEALPEGSPVVIYGGEKMSARLAERAACHGYRVVRYGIAEETTAPLDIVASDIVVDELCTHFTWRWTSESLELHVTLPLPGQHNILNVSAALAVIHLLNLPLAELVSATACLQPVPHRLQLIQSSSGITIIDDAYNANPVGVHNGLDVLARMQGRTKILVTPGMVELGSAEEAENRRFGEHAARVCDHVVLVGEKQTQPILAGLRAHDFPPERIHPVHTLAEATTKLSHIARPGAVVLFANDLPDTYLELP
jgi:UDP-N-acetylmuramoyl-tripeptide--D-alanyl-D-alanine ligase